MKILVIDDEQLMLDSLAGAISGNGMEVCCAKSADAGLRAAQSECFDVVVLDIWMPGMDGLALIKAIRASNPSQRIIAMTGGGPALPTETVAAIAGIWGAEYVFVKPFDENILVEALKSGPRRLEISPAGHTTPW